MLTRPFGTLLLAALLAGPTLAEEKAMGPPKPPAELSKLASFSGTWTCTGKTFANPFGPEHATEATFKASTAVGGMWRHWSYDEKKTDANANPVHAAMYVGYDAERKVFVMGCVDSFGGYCTSTSNGWNGDVMAFEGVVSGMGAKTPSRDTFTKKGDSLVHLGELQGPDGKWMNLDEETCQKAAAKK